MSRRNRRPPRRRPRVGRVTAPTTFEAALRFLADHPDPAAVVPCIMPDGSQGWMPRPVADLVEAMPAAPAARLRRTLGKQGDGATPVWAAWLATIRPGVHDGAAPVQRPDRGSQVGRRPAARQGRPACAQVRCVPAVAPIPADGAELGAGGCCRRRGRGR